MIIDLSHSIAALRRGEPDPTKPPNTTRPPEADTTAKPAEDVKPEPMVKRGPVPKPEKRQLPELQELHILDLVTAEAEHPLGVSIDLCKAGRYDHSAVVAAGQRLAQWARSNPDRDEWRRVVTGYADRADAWWDGPRTYADEEPWPEDVDGPRWWRGAVQSLDLICHLGGARPAHRSATAVTGRHLCVGVPLRTVVERLTERPPLEDTPAVHVSGITYDDWRDLAMPGRESIWMPEAELGLSIAPDAADRLAASGITRVPDRAAGWIDDWAASPGELPVERTVSHMIGTHRRRPVRIAWMGGVPRVIEQDEQK